MTAPRLDFGHTVYAFGYIAEIYYICKKIQMMKRILFSFLLFLSLGLCATAQDVRELNSENFISVVNGDRPFAIDFSAVWCGPCRMFAPIYAEVATEMKDRMVFYKVDVDKEQELAAQLGINSIPTILIFNPANKQSNVIQGLVDKDTFIAEIDKVFKNVN